MLLATFKSAVCHVLPGLLEREKPQPLRSGTDPLRSEAPVSRTSASHNEHTEATRRSHRLEC